MAVKLRLEPIEMLQKHSDDIPSPPCVEDLDAYIRTNTELSEGEVKKLRDRYIDEGYIEVEKNDYEEDTEISATDIEKLKTDIGYVPPFEPEDDDLNQSRLAQEFAEWVVDYRNVLPVVLDPERGMTKLYSYTEAEGVWHPNGQSRIKTIGMDRLGGEFSRSFRRELEEALQHEKFWKPLEDMGLPRTEILVENGALNLETGEIRDSRAQDLALRRLPVKFHPEKDAIKWKNYLKESVSSEEQIKKLQEFVGYCLMKDTCKHEKALLILGPTDSGKTVFLEVVEALLGADNTANQALQYISNHRWGTAKLLNQLANIRHDLPPNKIKDLGIVKEMISGNPIHAEEKGEKTFEFKPTAKHLYSANRTPKTNSEDKAYLNRWLIVTFPETVPEEEQDKELADKLIEEELSGILNWALEGYRRLREQDEFTDDREPIVTRQKMDAWGDSVQQFLANHTLTRVTAKRNDDIDHEEMTFRAKHGTLYKLYQKFAEENELEIESKKAFTQKVKSKKGVMQGRYQFQGEENLEQKNGFKGIKLEENAYKEIKGDGE